MSFTQAGPHSDVVRIAAIDCGGGGGVGVHLASLVKYNDIFSYDIMKLLILLSQCMRVPRDMMGRALQTIYLQVNAYYRIAIIISV